MINNLKITKETLQFLENQTRIAVQEGNFSEQDKQQSLNIVLSCNRLIIFIDSMINQMEKQNDTK